MLCAAAESFAAMAAEDLPLKLGGRFSLAEAGKVHADAALDTRAVGSFVLDS
jgi:hypothetical protein